MKTTILIFIFILTSPAGGYNYLSKYKYTSLDFLTTDTKNWLLYLANTEIMWIKDKKDNTKKFIISNSYTGKFFKVTKKDYWELKKSEYKRLKKKFRAEAGIRTYNLRARKKHHPKRDKSNRVDCGGNEALDNLTLKNMQNECKKNRGNDGITPINCDQHIIVSPSRSIDLNEKLPNGLPFTLGENAYPNTPTINRYFSTSDVKTSLDYISPRDENESSPYFIDGLGGHDEFGGYNMMDCDGGLLCDESVPKTPSYN